MLRSPMKEETIRRSNKKSGKAAALKRAVTQSLSIPDSWTAFERSLADSIRDLGEDEFLVIERKNTHHFVQFAAQGFFGLRAEAAANAYQPKSERNPELGGRLMQMGWKSPTYVQSLHNQEPADGSPNFYLDVASPVPYAEISALAVETLRGPFGARHPGELQYEAFSSASVSIRFPQLGIKRRDSVRESLTAGPLPALEEPTLQIILPAVKAVC